MHTYIHTCIHIGTHNIHAYTTLSNIWQTECSHCRPWFVNKHRGAWNYTSSMCERSVTCKNAHELIFSRNMVMRVGTKGRGNHRCRISVSNHLFGHSEKKRGEPTSTTRTSPDNQHVRGWVHESVKLETVQTQKGWNCPACHSIFQQ